VHRRLRYSRSFGKAPRKEAPAAETTSVAACAFRAATATLTLRGRATVTTADAAAAALAAAAVTGAAGRRGLPVG
jgi:hypothetical protein